MIPIADAHVHLWDLKRHCYPWLTAAEPEGPFGKTSRIRHDYLLDDYFRDAKDQQVTRMVHIEAGWDPDDPLGEIAWIQSLHDEHGAPHGHVAHIDLKRDDVASLLDRHAAFNVFCGVRDRVFAGDFTKAGGDGSSLDDPLWRRGIAELDRRGLAFDLQAPPALAAKAAKLARDHPGIRFVLTGAGYPPSPEDRQAFAQWQDAIAMLAAEVNIVAKLSCLPLVERRWVAGHAEQSAKLLIDIFGPARVLLASNFPVDRLFVTLDEDFGGVRCWIADRSEQDQSAILYGNTVRTYRLDENER